MTTNPQKQINFMESLNDITQQVKGYWGKTKNIRENKKLINQISMIIAGITIIGAGIFVYTTYQQAQDLNSQKNKLITLSEYPQATWKNNTELVQYMGDPKTIYDLLKKNKEIQNEIQKYNAYSQETQLPHEYFLQYLLLPKLNIRKNIYTKQIDTKLIGLNFLEKNPYNDINLLKKRNDFFANIGYLNETNEVNDINIGDITPAESGLFLIPIEISFTAPSKRALLMLIDKISLTSEKTNVALLEEFFTTLRKNIKSEKKTELLSIQSGYQNISGLDTNNINTIIGYNLQNRLQNTGNSELMDDNIILKTIQNVADCTKQSTDKCLYQFREKYRGIPSFAYILGTELGKNKTEELKKFLNNMPPIFGIKDFTFNKVKGEVTESENAKYIGKISLNVYGQNISQEETEEISKQLGILCFKIENQPMSPEKAIEETDNVIGKIANYTKAQTNQNSNIWELKDILQKTATEYSSLENYQKVIKTFEIYRMLNEGGICKN